MFKVPSRELTYDDKVRSMSATGQGVGAGIAANLFVYSSLRLNREVTLQFSS